MKKRVGNSDDSSLKVRKGILSLAAVKCILHSRSFGDLGLEIYIILFARLGLIKTLLVVPRTWIRKQKTIVVTRSGMRNNQTQAAEALDARTRRR